MKKFNFNLFPLALMVTALASGCAGNPNLPDPGFTVVTVRTNSLNIDAPMPGTAVSGFTDRPAAGQAYGNVKSFGIVYSSSPSAYVAIRDGFAPAFWVLKEYNGPCAGQSAAGGIERAAFNYLNCTQIRLSLPIAFIPSRIDAEAMPATWTLRAGSLNANYGMPTIQLYDPNNGTLVCQMQASYIADDQTWIEGSPWNLQYVPSGNYLVQVWNATADGTGEYVGHTAMNLYRTSELPPDADNDGFRADIDCDDSDSSIYPGAGTSCQDGEDRNCNFIDDHYDCNNDCSNPIRECIQ